MLEWLHQPAQISNASAIFVLVLLIAYVWVSLAWQRMSSQWKDLYFRMRRLYEESDKLRADWQAHYLDLLDEWGKNAAASGDQE